jgi:hypothetical protein
MKSIKTLGLFVFLLMAFTSSGQKFRYIKTKNYEGVEFNWVLTPNLHIV